MQHRREDGFTLLEIMVVVMIIGLLVTLVSTQLFSRAGEAQVTLAATQIRQLEQALELYKLDNGRYPTTDQGLSALVTKPSGSPEPRRYPPGGYVKPNQIEDPWSMPFQYRYPGERNQHGYDIWSLGPDGLEGGAESDDIVSWTTES